MQNTLTGKDVLALVPTSEKKPERKSSALRGEKKDPNRKSEALETTVATAQSTIIVALHALARNTHHTIHDVPVAPRDIEVIIEDVRLTLEAEGMHELPGETGANVRAGRDMMIAKLRSLLVGTQKA